MERDSTEFGKYPVITNFENNSVSVRKGDGSLVTTGVSPYPAILHGYVTSQHWEDATKLCRFVKDNVLWACLAGMAVHAKHLDTAEVLPLIISCLYVLTLALPGVLCCHPRG